MAENATKAPKTRSQAASEWICALEGWDVVIVVIAVFVVVVEFVMIAEFVEADADSEAVAVGEVTQILVFVPANEVEPTRGSLIWLTANVAERRRAEKAAACLRGSRETAAASSGQHPSPDASASDLEEQLPRRLERKMKEQKSRAFEASENYRTEKEPLAKTKESELQMQKRAFE